MPQLASLLKGLPMFQKQHAVVLAAGLLALASAHAQVAVTLDAGTTGAGAHLVVPMETYLNGRFGVNAFTHNFDKQSGGVDYDIKAKLQTVDVLFDWYLREGSAFRLTGGVLYNGTKADAHAKSDSLGKFTLNGTSYTLADVGVLDGRIDFRKAAPYLGIGFGNPLAGSSHWQFSGDLGAFYQGKANVQLAAIGCATSPTVCKQLVKDVAAEAVKLQDDASSYKLYPVVRASLSYRF
jgi:hypothetical protein